MAWLTGVAAMNLTKLDLHYRPKGRRRVVVQNKRERHEKRVRRRAGNRELRRLLSTDCSCHAVIKQVEVCSSCLELVM